MENERKENEFDPNIVEYINSCSIKEFNQMIVDFKESKERKELGYRINRVIKRKILCESNSYTLIIFEYYYFDQTGNKKYERWFPEKYSYLKFQGIDPKFIFEEWKSHLTERHLKDHKVSYKLAKYHSTKWKWMLNQTKIVNKISSDEILISIDEMYEKERTKWGVKTICKKIYKVESLDKENNKIIFFESKNNKVFNSFQKWKELLNNISKYFLISSKTKFIILGDGATWIRKIAKIANAKFIFDSFHFFKAVSNCLNLKKMPKKLREEIKKHFDNQTPYKFLTSKTDNPTEFWKTFEEIQKLKLFSEDMREQIKQTIKTLKSISPNLELYYKQRTASAESAVSFLKSITKTKYFATYGEISKNWMLLFTKKSKQKFIKLQTYKNSNTFSKIIPNHSMTHNLVV